MKISTMSIVCGTTACNARCPFCVSKTTPEANLTTDFNWRNLNIACRLAEKAGATTCLITGKGEPTLYPKLIEEYIRYVNKYFPFIELQTNGIALPSISHDTLELWYDMGLTTVSLSAVHYDQFTNEEIYGANYTPLEDNIKRLHDIGFSVRLSMMILKGYGLDYPQGISSLISFAKRNKVEQLTVRQIDQGCTRNENQEIFDWIDEHMISHEEWIKIQSMIDRRGNAVLRLPWGAVVYDVDGQNICLNNCLTTNEDDENIRQIIFFPSGQISYDWKYKGSRLI